MTHPDKLQKWYRTHDLKKIVFYLCKICPNNINGDTIGFQKYKKEQIDIKKYVISRQFLTASSLQSKNS